MKAHGFASRNIVIFSTLALIAVLGRSAFCRVQGSGGERIKQQEIFRGGNILSPGTRDDWPLKARDGETVIVSVTSQVFDPSVELIGPKGEVLGKNDDVRQGEQNALLLVRIDKGGDYQVRVTSPNATAGGRYEITVRRFLAIDLTIGSRAASTLGKTISRWHRFPADADRSLVVTARAATFSPSLEVIAPNGESIPIHATGVTARGTTRVLFRAGQAGNYYVRIAPGQGGDPLASYALMVANARALSTAIGDSAPERSIDVGGLDLWSFKAEAGDLVRARAKAAAGEMSAQISFVPPIDSTGKPQSTDGPVLPIMGLPSNPKANDEFIALLNLSGTYQVAVSQPLGISVRYNFTITRASKSLVDDGAPASTLVLGSTDYWTFEGAPGQIVRFDARSEQFDAELELFGPQGDPVARDDDGGAGHDARLTALLTERGRYLLRVHAHGDGGAGSYTLRRELNPTRPLALGGRGEGTVGSGGSEVWEFEGRAGQTIILSARSADFNVKIALFGPDAAEIASDDDSGEGTDSLLSARLPVDGKYTVWVTSAAGAGAYSVLLIEAR